MMPLALESAERTVQRVGIAHSRHIASGMEGHVFDIGAHSVAKVWHAKPLAEATQLQRFYEALQQLNLPFATPVITSLEVVEGITISIEDYLSGTSLRDLIDMDHNEVPEFAADAVITVLRGLKEAHFLNDAEHGLHLPIIGSMPSASAMRQGPTAQLLDIARQKVAKYGKQLRTSLPDFDWLYARTVHHLLNFPIPETHPVHGDICSPNILVDESGKVSAVLDWGLFSLFGDPALDASIASGIYNMYGPHHRKLDDDFLAACESQLGHSRDRLLLYRSLYALMCSNAYAENGDDGHYAWCVENLAREDVRRVLAQEAIA